MPLFSFAIGLTLRRGEQLLEFRRHLPSGDVQFEDPITGRIYSWSMGKIYREINNGDLVIVRGVPQSPDKNNNGKPNAMKLISNVDSLPEKFRDDLARRLEYINGCKKKGITKGRRKEIKEAISQVAKRLRQKKPPSPSTVMTWWRDFDKSDLYHGSLVSGNYERKRSQKISFLTMELIRKVLKSEYFTKNRYPLTRSHLIINRELNQRTDIEQEEVSLSTVRRVANEVTPYYRDVHRYGPTFARNKWRYSLKGVHASRVLERVEIDHTILDIVVVCDKSGMPLGRPTITIVIDAYSGYVISFFVSFWGTGLGPTLNALKIAISPKDSYTSEKNDISNPWMGYGIPELIVVDNGLEFHSRQFQNAAWLLNSDIEYCAVRQPWLKPHVERALGVQSLYLPGAGKVHKPCSNYLAPNPRKTACITFSQLCIALLKYFVDVLPFEHNKRTLLEPFEVFREGFERIPPALLLSSFEELELIGAVSKQLTVRNEGVVTDYLRYNSAELAKLRQKISVNFKTTVKFKPEDLDFIYVQDPISKKWLLVPSCNPDYTSGLSVVQHHAIREHLKGQLNIRNSIEILRRGKIELIDFYDGFLTGNRSKKNVKTAQKFGALTSAQILTESAQQQRPKPQESSLVTQDSCDSAIEIPTFDSFLLD